MIHILFTYLIGIFLAIKSPKSTWLIITTIIIIYYLINKKINKNKNGRFISKKETIAQNISITKIIILSLLIFIGFLYTNFRIKSYDEKYVNSSISGDFTIISKEEETSYYDKYNCKNNKGDKFILKINKNLNIKLEVQNKIFLEGEFKLQSLSRNEGGYNYRRYLNSKNIYGIINVNRKTIVVKDVRKIDFITKIKYYIQDTFSRVLPKDYAGIINGMLNGDTKNVSENILEDFKNSGVTHLLAVSGSNIAYIIMFLSIISNKIFGKYFSYYVLIFSIIIFIFVSGASASVARAGIMAILNIIATIFSKKSNTINNICFSALILLIINPLTIYDVGFILSFVGTLGIVLLSTDIINFIRKYIKAKILSETIGVTLSAQIMLTPVMLFYFNTFSLVSLITNFLIVPISSFLTILGFIVVIISLVSIELAKIFSYPIYALVFFMFKITNFFGKIPFANILVPTPKMYVIIGYYTIILIISKKVLSKKQIFKTIMFFVIITFFIENIPNNCLKLSMVDVGQGDSCYIETPNKKTILIDGGGTEGSDYDIGENILIPYLLSKGKTKIDLIIISHPHEDHIEGVFTVIEQLKVKKVVISKMVDENELIINLKKICQKRGTEIIEVSKGDTIKLDQVTFEILYPYSKSKEENLNNMSIVTKMSYKGATALFTGDLEKEREIEITSDISADILKVGHHGSTTSTSEKFLKKVLPKIALISVGENNSYGHPSDEIIRRLERVGASIYRTDICGEISLKINKKGKISVSTML